MLYLENVFLGVTAFEHKDIYPPFGKPIFFFEDMERSFPERDFQVFYFSPLNWQANKIIQGYIFRNQKWIPAQAPLPQIIYPRATGGDVKAREVNQKFEDFLIEKNIKTLNPIPLRRLCKNKVEFSNFLKKHKTLQFKSYNLQDFLDNINSFQNQSFYLKDIKSSQGKNIYKINLNQNNEILFQGNEENQSFKSKKSFTKYLKQNFNLEDFFVQEEAQIHLIDNRVWDIRVLLQNNAENNYQITGTTIRLGQEKSITSNLNTGGEILSLNEINDILEKKYQSNALKLAQELEQISLQLAKIIHQEFGNFLEIGLDFLLTKDKGLIILEGNANPARWSFMKLFEKEKIKNPDLDFKDSFRYKSVRKPLEYVDFLFKNN